MRAEGTPPGVAVASVIAFASSGSCDQASVIHSWNFANGSVTTDDESGIGGVSLLIGALCGHAAWAHKRQWPDGGQTNAAGVNAELVRTTRDGAGGLCVTHSSKPREDRSPSRWQSSNSTSTSLRLHRHAVAGNSWCLPCSRLWCGRSLPLAWWAAGALWSGCSSRSMGLPGRRIRERAQRHAADAALLPVRAGEGPPGRRDRRSLPGSTIGALPIVWGRLFRAGYHVPASRWRTTAAHSLRCSMHRLR